MKRGGDSLPAEFHSTVRPQVSQLAAWGAPAVGPTTDGLVWVEHAPRTGLLTSVSPSISVTARRVLRSWLPESVVQSRPACTRDSSPSLLSIS